MAEPQVNVLGPLQLSVNDLPVALGATMLRAVLARLVIAGGRAVSTDRLVDDLWEGQPPPSAASVLQVHIHNLRRTLEPDRARRAPCRYLVSESSGYALKLDTESVDAWCFEQRLRAYEECLRDPARLPDPRERRRMLDAALACWNGAPFEGLTGFAWAAREVSRLTDLRLTAAELRAQIELDLNRPTEVAIELRPLFDDHPEREECARLLATAQYRLGQQAQALATIRRAREYLLEEFGIDPGPALCELETAILSHSVALTAADPTATPAARAAEVRDTRTYCGYGTERAALLRVAAETRGGQLSLAWISGEAGAGKTTLADAVLGQLAGQQGQFADSGQVAGPEWTVVRGGCPEVDGAPVAWAWAEIIAELDPSAPDVLAAGDAFTVARTVVKLCRQASAARPVAILLEDAHRADDATTQVLRQVVSWLRNEPVLIAVTLRGSEAGPELRATAAALAHSTAEWVELSGVDLEATRQVALDAGLDDLSRDTVELLHRRTGGNPLFIREMAKTLAAQQASGDTAGYAAELPDSIRELINHRLTGLPDGVAEALAHLSIWGDGVDLRILSLAMETGEDELIDVIAAAEAAGLVRTDRTGRITFDHALIHDTVYLRIPTLRRIRMHWAALELLETHADEYPGLARDPEILARHAILGARPDTAAHALTYVAAAVRRCTERHMRSDSAKLWRAAVDLHALAGHDGEQADRADRTALFRARCQLVNALGYQGHLLEARAERDRAIALARQLDDHELLVCALTCWRAPVVWAVQDYLATDNTVQDLITECLAREQSTENKIRLLIAAVYAFTLTPEGLALGHQRGTQAVALARCLGDPELLCAALNAAMYIRFDGSVYPPQLAQEMLAVAKRAGLSEYRTLAHYALYRRALYDAELAEAARQAATAIEGATDGQLPQLMEILQVFTAISALLCGDIPTARKVYYELGARMAQHGNANATVLRVCADLGLAWAQGDLAPLAKPLSKMYSQLPNSAAQPYIVALLHAGEPSRARALYDRYSPEWPYYYPFVLATFRAHAALRFGDVREIRRLYDKLVTRSGRISGMETLLTSFGPVDAILAELAAALGDSESATIHRNRADQLLRRIRADLSGLEARQRHPAGAPHLPAFRSPIHASKSTARPTVSQVARIVDHAPGE
ncbi:BTAD domain-containing putative transcriptional regulator [Nocardia sp. NPDC050406]|uniref:BTAD domain-containing putative transcriptional regulator n=1 Tax=Nocardia sp. NPDC050406 TaxID=3364318 RepID=UPI00378F09B4